jgi:hypothetical protein
LTIQIITPITTPNNDTVCLLFNRALPRKFSKLNVSSIAIPFDWRGLQFTAADAKMFTGLEEIVLLVGRQRAGCDAELPPSSNSVQMQQKTSRQQTQLLDSQIDLAEESDRDLRQELELNPILELGADVVQDREAKDTLYEQLDVAFQSANELHEEMIKISKKWKSYQRSRVKKGKVEF